ncbi:MAG: PorV/PorQ family protein [Bacteroidia bacterium]|nr:PorV/PorQ family protein [Bacteroidia bacterium]
MKKVFSVLIFVLALAEMAGAQGIEGTAMSFSAVPGDIVSISKGGADALQNPAARLFGKTDFDVQAAYASWGPKSGIKSNNINLDLFYKCSDKLAVTTALQTFLGMPYVESASAVQTKEFSPNDIMIKAGAAYKFTDNLSAGVNARYMSSSLSSSSSLSAFGADAHIAADFNGLRAMAGICNIGTKVESAAGGSYSLPTSILIAGGYSSEIPENGSIDTEIDVRYLLCGALDLAAGIQYCWKDMLSVRAGYHKGAVYGDFLSLGAGVKFSGVKLDAAYLAGSGPLGGSLMFGLGYSF